MLSNGAPVVPDLWQVTLSGSVVSYGSQSPLVFAPTAAGTYVVSATIRNEFGLSSSNSFTATVSAPSSAAFVRVSWTKTFYSPGETISATIFSQDSFGIISSPVLWTLLLNGVAVTAGTSGQVYWPSATTGHYHLTGQVSCLDGAVLQIDSCVEVLGSVNVRHAAPTPIPNSTLAYLGEVYTEQYTGPGGVTTLSPTQLASFTQDLWLLPGTTHWSASIVGLIGQQPPEVVVRTKAGNWCLNGYPYGLTGQDTGYDYQQTDIPVPAPADYRLKLTSEAWMPTAGAWTAFTFRVRILCYRTVPAVYMYSKCAYGSYPGGTGRRARRFSALFTNMSVQTDVATGLNRYFAGDSLIEYSTPETSNVPLMDMLVTGNPNPSQYYSGLFFTDSNKYSIYEAPGYPNIYAKSISGYEGISPGYVSLLSFSNDIALVNNRIKRVYGNLVIYVVEGAVYQGSVVTIKVWRSCSTAFTTYTGTVANTVYANEQSTAARALSIPVDISDWQFDETGIVYDIIVDETNATQSAVPTPTPAPVEGYANIYSTYLAPSVSFDGACYSNPTHVAIFSLGMTGPVVSIAGCHLAACGPQGLYCYAPVYGGGPSIQIPQPLGFPSTYVASGTDAFNCYQYAAFLGEYTDTGTASYIGYAASKACGFPYLYTLCASIDYNRVPFDSLASLGAPSDLVVVFPPTATPFPAVAYNQRCYGFSGTITSAGTRFVVGSTDVAARLSCTDALCTNANAAGTSYMYYDTLSGLPVPVNFTNLDSGIPYFGVVGQTISTALPAATYPQLYASTPWVMPQTSAIIALGFCGYTDQSSYTFYGSLPALAKVATAPNPDTYVTVQSGSSEYLLVTASGSGDFALPLQVQPYAGQMLSGSIAFNFYTGRSSAGAHGEMDVWLSSSGSFPSYLQAGPYRTLALTGQSYRKNAEATDMHRNSCSVASGTATMPSRYVSDAGRVRSFVSTAPTYVQSGTTYTRVDYDLGLAYTIDV